MAIAEVLEVTLRVVDILEGLGVPYLVGGSVASSLHGIPRSTQDVDLAYLHREAKSVGLGELLERALREAGLPDSERIG